MIKHLLVDDLILIVVSIDFSVYIYQQVLGFFCAGNYPTNIPIKIIFITNIITRKKKKISYSINYPFKSGIYFFIGHLQWQQLTS